MPRRAHTQYGELRHRVAPPGYQTKGFVYFIQARSGGPIKIGFSATREGTKGRLRSLQTAHHYRLVIRHVRQGTVADERRLHSELREHRVLGEWFWPTEEVLRTCDLVGRAKVGGKMVTLYDLERSERAARRDGARSMLLAIDDVLRHLDDLVDSGDFDADTLCEALARRLAVNAGLGHFMDTASPADGSTRRQP